MVCCISDAYISRRVKQKLKYSGKLLCILGWNIRRTGYNILEDVHRINVHVYEPQCGLDYNQKMPVAFHHHDDAAAAAGTKLTHIAKMDFVRRFRCGWGYVRVSVYIRYMGAVFKTRIFRRKMDNVMQFWQWLFYFV